MARLAALYDKGWKINLLLFFCSFGVYFLYFHHVLLNINSILSSITSDALKNYYTYVYHISNDRSLLHFEGMNYPFGEHVTYTDCQPLLTFILRWLPFTHNYLIGILHALIFFSYCITPVILYNILQRLQVNKFTSFFAALAIAFLSPQYWRLDGHFALTYECVIPIAILLVLKFFQEQKTTTLWQLVFYNSALFLIHPYLGLGLSAFCLIALFVFELITNQNKVRHLLQASITGILPIVLFKLFLFFTDQHTDRTSEPFGIDVSVANIASVFVAGFGPFEHLMKACISNGPQEFEGLAYLGFFMVCLVVIFLLAFVFFFKKLVIKKEVLCLGIAALLLLFFSFGLHNKLLQVMHSKIELFNQFRSLGRFAWFFYYVAPVFIFSIFYHSLQARLSPQRLRYVFGTLAVLFLAFNLLEAHYMFVVYAKGSFKDRNIFRAECLTPEEKAVLESMREQRPQAILPLPTYYLGSEVYGRVGGGNSMLPSMIYSYHAATPIAGGSLSRTSLTETEDGIELLNAYKRKRRAIALSNEQPFLVIKTNDVLLPDEERLFKKTKVFYTNDSAQTGYVTKNDLLNGHLSRYVYQPHKNSTDNKDSSQVFYIHWENRRPFLPSKNESYENLLTVDSNSIKTGRYVVSMHYHFAHKTYRDVANNLIVTREHGEYNAWEYTRPICVFSGFYPGFAVFEYAFALDHKSRYSFLLKGDGTQQYWVSDFLIRPDTTDVRVVMRNGDTLINNFQR